MSNFSGIDARHTVSRDQRKTNDTSQYQPLESVNQSRPETPSSHHRSTFITGSLALAIFIIGIVAAANGWAHGAFSLSAVTAGAALTRFTIRAVTGDMTKKDWAFEIILLIALIAGAATTYTGHFSTQSLGHLLWASSTLIFFHFCKNSAPQSTIASTPVASVTTANSDAEIRERYRNSKHRRE